MFIGRTDRHKAIDKQSQSIERVREARVRRVGQDWRTDEWKCPRPAREFQAGTEARIELKHGGGGETDPMLIWDGSSSTPQSAHGYSCGSYRCLEITVPHRIWYRRLLAISKGICSIRTRIVLSFSSL